jgi:hypothetical protein
VPVPARDPIRSVLTLLRIDTSLEPLRRALKALQEWRTSMGWFIRMARYKIGNAVHERGHIRLFMWMMPECSGNNNALVTRFQTISLLAD